MDAFVILFTVILLASANGVLGTYLVLRKSVMIGDAISHAVLPGLIIGFLISGSKNSFPMLISAAISGVLTTLLIQYLNRKSNLPKDASIGFVFTTLFAIGIIMVSVYADNIDIDADCVLHGELGFIALENLKETVALLFIVVIPTVLDHLTATALILQSSIIVKLPK